MEYFTKEELLEISKRALELAKESKNINLRENYEILAYNCHNLTYEIMKENYQDEKKLKDKLILELSHIISQLGHYGIWAKSDNINPNQTNKIIELVSNSISRMGRDDKYELYNLFKDRM